MTSDGRPGAVERGRRALRALALGKRVGSRLRATAGRLSRALPGGRLTSLPGAGRAVDVPVVLQMEAVECGAACLGMILAYYGHHEPLEELRGVCGVSRDGSKASNLLRAARFFDLEAQGYRKEPEDLEEMELPVILHWNFNHFVVLEGFGPDGIYLKDPSQGRRTVTADELDSAFTGVVLALRPGPDFEPDGEEPSFVRSLLPRLRGSGTAVVFAMLASLVLVVPGLVTPSFSHVFVDHVLVRELEGWLRPLLLVMGAALAVKAGLLWLQKHHLLRLETHMALRESGRFLWHVLRLPYDFFVQRSAGDIASRVRLNNKVAKLLSTDLATTALDLLLITFYGLLMVQYDVILTVVGVVTALLNLAALKYSARKRTEIAQQVVQARDRLTGVAMGGLQSIEMLKASGGERGFFDRWSGGLANLVNAQQRVGAIVTYLNALPSLLTSVNAALILGIGGLRIMSGDFSIGMLLAFQVLLTAFLTPVNRLVNIGSKLQNAEAGLKRLDDIFKAEADVFSPPEDFQVAAGDGPASPDARSMEDDRQLPEGKLDGRVELVDVSFGYSELDPPLLGGFDLTLEPGARVALVGKTGSGKSTIARLVAGLHQPWDGTVLLDGRPRDEIDPRLLHSSLSMVEQDVFLFDGTVRGNLVLWDATVDQGAMIRAARDACIHDDIISRPGGYSSRVEEGGRNFSGGQRQRLELARALTKEPSVLVLDEATSALDPVTEARIDENLRRRGCTSLIVAHRLSTIRDCDEIVVLDQGRIVERGTHRELMERRGVYTELLEESSGAVVDGAAA